MAVDSFIAESGDPIAVDYVTSLGLDPTVIRTVVCTHWDDDHSKGLDQVIKRCGPDKVWFTSVLTRQENMEFMLAQEKRATSSPSGSGTSQFLNAARTLRTGELEWAAEGRPVESAAPAKVRCLSPSSQTITDGVTALGPLPDGWMAGERIFTVGPNRSSVALWVEYGSHDVLLGADLLNGRRYRGWRGVLSSNTATELKQRGRRATLSKVAHHGSPNARLAAVYRELCSGPPLALVSRFNSGSKPRPQQEDVDWYRGRCRGGFIAGQPGRRQALSTTALVRKANPLGASRVEGEVGHVRARIRETDPVGEWRIERDGQTWSF